MYLFLSYSNVFVHHYEIDYLKLILSYSKAFVHHRQIVYVKLNLFLPEFVLFFLAWSWKLFSSLTVSLKREKNLNENCIHQFVQQIFNLFSKFSICSSIYSLISIRHSILHLSIKKSWFCTDTRKFIQLLWKLWILQCRMLWFIL